MYLESVYVKIKGEKEFRKGYYIGLTDNSELATILDTSYKPIPESDIEDFRTRCSDVQFRCTASEDDKVYKEKYKTRKLDTF